MATAAEKRKPVFVKVEELKPGTSGHNLTVKVLNSKAVPVPKPRRAPMSLPQRSLRPSRIAECLVGDETGSIVFTARNDQGVGEATFLPCFNTIPTYAVDLVKPDTTIILRNAKIDMFKGSMRLAVDKWGRIEVTEPASFVVQENNNLSLVEYELVTVQG